MNPTAAPTFEQKLRAVLADPATPPAAPTIVVQPAPASGPYRWRAIPTRDPDNQLIVSVDLVPVERVVVPEIGAAS